MVPSEEPGQGLVFATSFTATVTTREDTAFAADIIDLAPAANGLLKGIFIESLPNNATLSLNGVACRVGQFVSVDDLGSILSTPQSNWPLGQGTEGNSQWSFAAVYSKTTQAGISYLYPVSSNSLTVTVSSVNDAPVLTSNNSRSVNEDSSVVLSTGLFTGRYRGRGWGFLHWHQRALRFRRTEP